MNSLIYTINYEIHLKSGIVENHTTKVKNVYGELHAKVELNEYLKKKYKDFNRLVILTCEEDNDFMNMWSNIFKP
jgi:hypothetical protein